MKHVTTFDPPNDRSGALTLSEYQMIEFDLLLSGRSSVDNAIDRSGRGYFRQAVTLPNPIRVVDAPIQPSIWRQLGGLLLVLGIAALSTAISLSVLVLVIGALIDLTT